MGIGLIGVGLFLLLVIQQADISAQQLVTNGSLNAANTTALNDTNTTSSNATNTTIRNAFDQLKDTFGSLFGK